MVWEMHLTGVWGLVCIFLEEEGIGTQREYEGHTLRPGYGGNSIKINLATTVS